MKHTEIVEAFSRMVGKQEGYLHIATRNNSQRSLNSEAEANAWEKAADLLIECASEDEQRIMNSIYHTSECPELREKIAVVRRELINKEVAK